jgi:hypothetical protein
MDETETSKLVPPFATNALDLVARRESYHRRLEDGYARIDEAALNGTDVSAWETFWLQLLREYEEVCRAGDIAA